MNKIKYGLKISTNSLRILDQIYLAFFKESRNLYNLKIIYIDGITNGKIHIKQLKEDIQSSRTGLNIKLDDLKVYYENFIDIFDLIIVGNLGNNTSSSSIDDDMEELIDKNDFIIELFDSTYWQLISSYRDTLDLFRKSILLNDEKSLIKSISDIFIW